MGLLVSASGFMLLGLLGLEDHAIAIVVTALSWYLSGLFFINRDPLSGTASGKD